MTAFTKRNLMIFFNDKAAVFFSMLATFIIIGLYILFLGDAMASGLSDFKGVREVMDNWIMAGLLATTSATTTMGAFSSMVYDKSNGVIKDFYVSPIDRRKLAGGYVISSLIIGFLMSFITFLLAEVYIVVCGGSFITYDALIKTVLILLYSSIINTSMMFFLTSFFRSMSAFSAFSTVLCTLMGFLTGIYLPIGQLPNAVQWAVKIFPTSHGAALLRSIMAEDSMSRVFQGLDQKIVNEFSEEFGMYFKFGDYKCTFITSCVYMGACAIVFFGLACFNLSKKQK